MRRTLVVVSGSMLVLVLAATVALAAPPAQPRNFVAPLSGAEEVLNGVVGIDTKARGVATFQLSADGTQVSYRVIASNIENVTMAHIHCCTAAGSNTGIAVWLYPVAPPPQLIPGRHSGTLITGTFTAADVSGPAMLTEADDPLAALLEQIAAGNAYVNVHTSQFPGGEIRGQLP